MNPTVEFEVDDVTFTPGRDGLMTVSFRGRQEAGEGGKTLDPKSCYLEFEDDTEIKLNELNSSVTAKGKDCRPRVIAWLVCGRCSFKGEERVDRYGAVTSAEFTRMPELG